MPRRNELTPPQPRSAAEAEEVIIEEYTRAASRPPAVAKRYAQRMGVVIPEGKTANEALLQALAIFRFPLREE